MDQLNQEELKQIAAVLAGVAETQVLKVRALEGGGLVVVVVPGSKFVYSADQVETVRAHKIGGVFRDASGRFTDAVHDADGAPEIVIKKKTHRIKM